VRLTSSSAAHWGGRGCRSTRAGVALLVLTTLSGCYSFSARTSRHIKSIAIPFFQNETLEYGLSERVTDALIAGFLEDNQLRVVSEGEADSMLEGWVIGYSRVPQVYHANEAVQLFRVYITVNLAYHDLIQGQADWEEPSMQEWGEYSLTGEGAEGRVSEEEAQDEAVAKILEKVLARTVESW
jgi:hypothetical protein